jgi:diaminopimelate epimerase
MTAIDLQQFKPVNIGLALLVLFYQDKMTGAVSADTGFSTMEIRFQKMHGTLNDFVVFHDLKGEFSLTPQQVALLCNRRSGVGGDGVIAIRPSDKADFFMDYINSDGSLAEMCGNGIRCVAKYAFDNGLTQKTVIPIETRAGIKVVEVFQGSSGKVERAKVDMGKPVFQPELIPAAVKPDKVPVTDQPVYSADRQFTATLISMGNPHCVIILDEDVERLPRLYGPDIEINPLFPAKTNVEFVRVADRGSIIMRVWERGSGETFSCGTGACASAVAAIMKGLVQTPVRVELLGGTLEVAWGGPDSPALMTGPAQTAFSGVISI